MGTSALLPEELELQDSMGPGTTPLVDVVLVSWTCSALELLITGLVLGWCLGRRLRRHWGEVKEGGQAGGPVPGAGSHQGLGPSRCRQGLRVPVVEQSRAGPEGAGPPGQPFGHGPAAEGAEPLGGIRPSLSPRDTRQRRPELFLLQPLPGAAQPGPGLSRRGQRQPERPQPALPLCPFHRDPCVCLAGEAPEPLGLCRAVLLPGTRLPQEADPAAEEQPCHAVAVPALLLSAEAQSQESSKRGHLEEEETPSLPSALTLQLQRGTLHAEHCGGCHSAQSGHCGICHLGR